jgi:phage repressor protein C with HTH and peptisase S24 domain
MSALHTPAITPGLAAFQIAGTSMAPTLCDGDIVTCRLLDTPETVINGELYAVKTRHDGVFVKYARKVYNARGRVGALTLLSADPACEPFEVEMGPDARVYRVLQVVKP